jgi:hypothetical protein
MFPRDSFVRILNKHLSNDINSGLSKLNMSRESDLFIINFLNKINNTICFKRTDSIEQLIVNDSY